MSQTIEQPEVCAHGHKRDDNDAHNGQHCDVTITFNGMNKEFKFLPHESVRALLDAAIRDFHIAQNPHTYGLFNGEGVELNDSQTLYRAGVRCGDTLLLRASVVRAGKC